MKKKYLKSVLAFMLFFSVIVTTIFFEKQESILAGEIGDDYIESIAMRQTNDIISFVQDGVYVVQFNTPYYVGPFKMEAGMQWQIHEDKGYACMIGYYTNVSDNDVENLILGNLILYDSEGNIIEKLGCIFAPMKSGEGKMQFNTTVTLVRIEELKKVADYDIVLKGQEREDIFDKILTDKGNISTIKYLYNDENFMNSMFVHENDGKFSAEVVMTATNMFYRGMDGWKDLFNGETAKQQAEELLAKLLYDFQDECKEVAYAKTAKKFSEALTSGAEYFMKANAIESSFSNEDIKNLNEALSPEVLGLVFKEHKYNYLENYLTVVKGYSSDDKLVKLLHNYLRSDEIIKSYKDNIKYLGDGIDIISMTNDTIKKLYEVDALYNSNELYSEMLLYLKENCKYSTVCDAADELYTVVNGSYKEQLRYVSETLMNKMEDKLVDVVIDNLLDTTIAKMNYAFIIKEGFDWGVKISNFVWHTGEAQEQRDKMRSLAYIGNCLSQWMLNSNIEYFKVATDKEKQVLGLRTYYAAYMLWQTRKAGEEALQGYAELQGLTFRRWHQISKSISKTLDSLESTMFTKNNKAKLLTLTIACPIDVEISDNSGNIIAQITDGSEIQYFSEKLDYAVVYDPISKDYIKIIHLCDENEYKVRCIGNDLGQVDMNMMQITEDGKTKMKYVDDIGVEKQTTIEWIPLSNDSNVQVKNGNELKTYDLVESDDTYIPLKNVSFVNHNLEIQKGEKLRLDKVITPLDASDKLFGWTSDNASCVDVNNDGVIYGIDVGQATITISSLDGTLLDRCVIIVTEDHVKDNNGSDTSGTASGSGGSASGSNGNISGNGGSSVSESNGNIAGSDVDGKSDMEENTTLPESNPQDTEKTETYNIFIPSKKLAVGKRIKLALVNGQDAIDNSHVKWAVDNKKYATVNSQGVLICKKKGIGKTVVITANSEDGKNVLATVKIKIMKHVVTRVRIKTDQKKMKAGEQLRLQAIIETSGVGANEKLKWISSNSKYASVNSKGIVTAKIAGKGRTVTITAKATDGSAKKHSVKIRILPE